MEFKFNVNEVLKSPIVEINQNLIPPNFHGDRRALWETVTKVSEIVNALGQASASAQGLNKAVTTSDRLRNSDQTVYLLVDKNAKNGKGVVTGMLKTGKKSLYIFDRNGENYQVNPQCILDFYVHESRQRTGLGKQLFEHMLQKENTNPAKLAIDRPSGKLLSFLNKHYSLDNGQHQMNNFVVFDGFFPKAPEMSPAESLRTTIGDSESPNKTKPSANGLQQISSFGRYGAPRPPCSMGQIIHNTTSVQSNEPSGEIHKTPTESATQSPKLERPRSLTIQCSEDFENLDALVARNGKNEVHFHTNNIEIEKKPEIVNDVESIDGEMINEDQDDTDRSKSPNPLTAQGFVDLKFYHSRLW